MIAQAELYIVLSLLSFIFLLFKIGQNHLRRFLPGDLRKFGLYCFNSLLGLNYFCFSDFFEFLEICLL